MSGILLQAATEAATGAAPEGGMAAGLMQFLPFILIIVVFYFFMIKPQQQKQKELDTMRSELKKGDKVVTASGLRAKVAEVKEETIVLEIADGVKAEFEKTTVSQVIK